MDYTVIAWGVVVVVSSVASLGYLLRVWRPELRHFFAGALASFSLGAALIAIGALPEGAVARFTQLLLVFSAFVFLVLSVWWGGSNHQKGPGSQHS
jgi:hypothetical protein